MILLHNSLILVGYLRFSYFLVNPACTSLSSLMYLIWCSIFVLRIPINNLFVAFVSAIGRRSFIVGFFFFGINTVFEVYQECCFLFVLFCSVSQLRY